MKFCVNCGKQIKESTNFCPFCGAEQPTVKVAAESDAGTEAPLPRTEEVSENVPTAKPARHWTRNSLWGTLGIIIVVVGRWGYHQYQNYVPEGQTNPTSILKYTSKPMDSFVFASGVQLSEAQLDDEYMVYLNKNQRTGHYVFPVKDTRSKKVHYSYLISVGHGKGRTTGAVDINNVKWFRSIDNNKAATVVGNNPHAWSYKMTINYYNKHISNLEDAYQNGFK